MLIVGIDPGISGSICFFEDGKITDLVEMPSMAEGKKNKKQVNASQIYKCMYYLFCIHQGMPFYNYNWKNF